MAGHLLHVAGQPIGLRVGGRHRLVAAAVDATADDQPEVDRGLRRAATPVGDG